jgi:putative transposase of IS4/5 family DUF4096
LTVWTRIRDLGQLRLVIDLSQPREFRMDTTSREPYPSDLTDAEWAILEPLLPPPVPAGAPRKVKFREVINAIYYVLTTGCAWKA